MTWLESRGSRTLGTGGVRQSSPRVSSKVVPSLVVMDPPHDLAPPSEAEPRESRSRLPRVRAAAGLPSREISPGQSLPGTWPSASAAVRAARHAWERHERRVPVQLSLSEGVT